jgi:hypothetical protein
MEPAKVLPLVPAALAREEMGVRMSSVFVNSG